MNIIKKQIVLIFLSFFLLNISYAAGPALVPLRNPSKRISDIGLSILPPQGGGWFFLEGNPNGGLMFTKTIGSPQHTVVCSFTIVPISESIQGTKEFLETVKQMQMSNVDPNKFKNIKSNFSLNERFGSYSVEYEVSGLDMTPFSGRGTPLVQKMHGFTFVHPKQSGYMVDIVYSERDNSEEFSAQFQKTGQEFIDSLIIQ